MLTKSVIYLLPLVFASSHSRVATKTDELPEISNAIINENKLNNTLIVDLPIVRPLNNTPTESDIDLKIISLLNKNNCTEDLADNSIDSDITCSNVASEALILTKYIQENRLEEGRNASKVKPDLFLGVESYSGYFTVNETYGSNMFFWFFPVENKPVDQTPWIIWLQGGPGGTSMTGLFDEIGPFRYTSTGLVRNPYSWLRNHSLLFLDNPVGTGFSYTNHEDGYVRDMDTYGHQLCLATRQVVTLFPSLKKAPLFVAGESYGGKYAPALAACLHRQKDDNINLQGLITGNAYVEPFMISHPERSFYNFGMVDDSQVELVKPLLNAFAKHVSDGDSSAAKLKWNKLVTTLLLISHQKHAYNFLRDDLGVGGFLQFLRRPDVKEAIHVGSHECFFVNVTVNTQLDGDFLSSARGLYEELLGHYRVLTYCGQLDLMVPCVMTSEIYRRWEFSGATDFRTAKRYPFLYNGKLAGYHKSGGNLTEVVIRGAGHMAPRDAPPQTRALVTLWTHGKPLGSLPLLESNFIQQYVANASASTVFL